MQNKQNKSLNFRRGDANLYTFLNEEALNAKCLFNINADKHFLVFKSLEYVNAAIS